MVLKVVSLHGLTTAVTHRFTLGVTVKMGNLVMETKST
jgi:hypothetical protein